MLGIHDIVDLQEPARNYQKYNHPVGKSRVNKIQ